MAKNVYLLVTDLHIGFKKPNRKNYLGEVMNAMSDIMNIADKYSDCGKLVLILLGDVFDNGVTDASEAMQLLEVFRYFCKPFNEVYAVVGNHEITFAKNNPFWFLTQSIEDTNLLNIKRFIQPRGLSDTINIVDTITDGNVKIYFNHFGIKAKTPKGQGTHIGLFHQNVGSNEICKMWGTFDDVEEADYIQSYNYCFFGHMHLAKGKYFLNKSHTCLGEWLGTIGRTKINEVLDDSLSVNIPALCVTDGELVCIEDNFINLGSSSDCINFEELEISNKNKELINVKNKIVVSDYNSNDLFETLSVSFKGTEFEFLLNFLDQSWDSILMNYRENLHKIVIMEESNND